VHADLWPHRTLLLDVPVALGAERARSRRGQPDRIEQETAAFFERVRQTYRQIAEREPQRVRLLDATAEPAPLLAQALAALSDLLPRGQPAAAPGVHGAR